MIFEKYKKDLPYSYAFGAFGTIELLKKKNSYCKAVLIDPSFTKNDAFVLIQTLCKENNIEIIINHNEIAKIRDKDNIYVIGVFKKYNMKINNNRHIIIKDINDYGLIGTIIRSMNGFNYHDLVLINCDIDIYNEHLIRASMGAFFSINIAIFKNIEDYFSTYKNNKIINVTKNGNAFSANFKDDNYSYMFSNDIVDENNVVNYRFDKDISLDNVVNIILFSTYKE